MMLIISMAGLAFAAADPADAGATAAALPYQLAFALSTLFAAVVLITALWKIR